MMDFVYIIKKDERNEDLRYSLRSIAKYYPDNKVWIVGYKPSWVTNVNYLPVDQSGPNKWKISVNNIISACKNEEISEDFILMNDDFFIVSPKYSLENIIDSNLGQLDKAVVKYASRKNGWSKAFAEVNKLLDEIGVPKPYYNYEAHLPIKINKKKFLEVISLPEVQDFMKTNKVLHKRTLYKNYDKVSNGICICEDVKIFGKLPEKVNNKVNICGWISVADGVIGNSKLPIVNNTLRNAFTKPCKYEASGPTFSRPMPRIRKNRFF